LSVSDVRVYGADGKLADQIIEVADAPLGEPLARVETGAIADRVEDVREVSAVVVKRSWPTALTIEVTQREPVAAVPDDSSWWRMDADGVLFAESTSRPKGLPVVEVSVSSSDETARAMGAAVVGSLPNSVAKKVDLVRVESVADVQLDLKNGSTVVWGTSEHADDKAAVLQALLKEHKGEEVTYNVSAPDNPAVTP
jgi:cell division protein FtsQ